MSWSVVLGLFTVVTTAPPPHPAATASARPAAPVAGATASPLKATGTKPDPTRPAPPRRGQAEPPPTKPAPPALSVRTAIATHVRVVRPPPPPPEPEGPPPNVKLTIVAPSTHTLWGMHVENLESVPVRLVADAYLLSFDVTPPGQPPVHCVLPSDMRATDDEERVLVLPPKRSYAEAFDPRLYCFGVKETPALAVGATVVAHLGWAPVARHHTQLHVLTPIDGVVPEVNRASELVSSPFTIPADTIVTADVPAEPVPSPVSSSAATATAEGPGPPVSAAPSATNSAPPAPPEPPVVAIPEQLKLDLPARLDVERPGDLSVSLRLSNEGTHPVTLLFRAEVIDFIAISAYGGTRCRWASRSDTPIRELFTTLHSHQTASADVLLPDLCGSQFFDTPGLYVLRGELDTRHSSGASIGLSTFDGQVVAQAPMLVRVRAAKDGRPRPRPRLE